MRLSPELTAKVEAICREAGTLPPLPVKLSALEEHRAEEDFQAAIVREAKRYGWLVFHPRDSRKSEKGYPDLTLARGHRVLFWELKSATGTVSAAQATWGEVLAGVGGTVEYAVLRPHQWPAIVEALR